MSVTVVKEDGFEKDNPVICGAKYLKSVKYDGTVTVPDMSDYYTRASNTDLRDLKNELKEDIKDSNETLDGVKLIKLDEYSKVIKGPAMSEDLDIIVSKSGKSKVIPMFESSSNKY